MLVRISNRIVPMPNASDSHSAVAISRAACGGLLLHIVLGEFGDLVGERLKFGNDRQGDLAGDADGFFVQFRNLCGGVGAACGGDRFSANSRDLLCAFGIVVPLSS